MELILKTKGDVARILGIDRKTLYRKMKNKNIEFKRERLKPFEFQQLIDLCLLSDEEYDNKYCCPKTPPNAT